MGSINKNGNNNANQPDPQIIQEFQEKLAAVLQENAIEMCPEELSKELVMGAVLFCDMGSDITAFKIDPLHNTTFNKLPAANIKDCIKDTNIFPFGICSYAVANENEPFECDAHMVLPEEWTDPTLASGLSKPFQDINGQPTLSMASFMYCEYGGGRIYPILSGQTAYEMLRDFLLSKGFGEYSLEDFLAGVKGSCLFGSDPVNMVTGNFIYAENDLTLQGTFPMQFKRFYNSIGNSKSAFGKNWTHNFNITLTETDEYAEVFFEDGHAEKYRRMPDGSYQRPSDHFNRLEKKNSAYTLTLQNRDQYNFSQDGRLMRKVDSNGNATQYFYKKNLLSKVENLSGSLHFAYSKDLLLCEVSDHAGRTVCYEYLNKRLHKVLLPTGGFYQYGYNAQNRLDKIIDPAGSCVLVNEYDDNYRVIKQTFPGGSSTSMDYESEVFTTVCTEQNGNTVRYVRDDKFRTVQAIYKDASEYYEYNTNDKRTAIIDRNGNKTQYQYDSNGNLIKKIDALINETEFVYDEENRLTKIVCPNGGNTILEYDSNGNLAKSIDAIGNIVKIEYGSLGQPVTVSLPNGGKSKLEYDSRGNIVALYNALGFRHAFEYNALNQVIKARNPLDQELTLEYDSSGNITKETNAKGFSRKYAYNKNNLLICFTDYNGNQTKYFYNEMNKVSKIVDPEGGETSFTYDSMWNVCKATNPLGESTSFHYNKYNWLEKVIDPEGNETTYSYDLVGNVTQIRGAAGAITQLCYDPCNRVVEAIAPDQSAVKYEYDGGGNLTRIQDALGNSTIREYNALGQLSTITNELGEITRYTYNALGCLESETDPSGNTTRYEYDLLGQMTRVIYPGGEFIRYAFDAVGNVIEKCDALGSQTRYKYNELNQIIAIINALGDSKTFTYDEVGNVIRVIDENGHQTGFRYSKLNKITEVIDALGYSTKYAYDATGNLTHIEQLRIIDKDLAGAQEINERQVTEYKRDKNGRVISVTDPLGGIVSYSYDAAGNVIEKRDKDGSLTQYVYDAINNLTHIQYADNREVALSYNPLRQLIEMKDWLGITDIEVDALGRATQVTHPDGKTVGFTYGLNGKRQSLTYPDGSVVEYAYDPSGKLKSVTAPAGKTQYSYDAAGRLAERDLPNGAKTRYGFDSLDRMSELTHLTSSGVLDQYVYNYDPVGNTIGIEKWRNSMKEDSGAFQYDYDPLNRLVQAGKSGDMRQYTYDSLGNRTRLAKNGQITNYGFNALNQLVKSESGNNVKEYSYDPLGNLNKILRNGKLDSLFEFDATGMLVHAKTDKGESHYSYNGMLKRVQTLQSNADGAMKKEINYTLNPTLPYFDLLHTSGTDAEQNYIWGSELIAAYSGSSSHYYLSDQLGSPIRLLGKDRSTKGKYTYDEFGNLEKDEAIELLHMGAWNPFGFTGYQNDAVTGLDFAQARFYQPESGRFMNEDLIRGVLLEPISINHYQYCFDNPMSRIDRDGMFTFLQHEPPTSTRSPEQQAKINRGALMALGGLAVVLTIASCGLATPLLVLVGVAAVGTVGYGVSEIAEGMSDNGYNPMRDGLMGGNQQAYDTTGNICSTVLSAYGLANMLVGLGSAIQALRSPVQQPMLPQSGPTHGAMPKEAFGHTKDPVDLYRAVGVREYNSIQSNNAFLPGTNSLEGRQFAMTFDEALSYANTDPSKVAIARATLPRNTLSGLDYSTTIDPNIFLNGVYTVQPNVLDAFNKSLSSIDLVY